MRCPICRADNNEGPACRRCRADLSLLFELEAHRGNLLRQAQQQAAHGQWPEATRLAEQAHALRRDVDTEQLIAVSHLMQRQYLKAWTEYEMKGAESRD